MDATISRCFQAATLKSTFFASAKRVRKSDGEWTRCCNRRFPEFALHEPHKETARLKASESVLSALLGVGAPLEATDTAEALSRTPIERLVRFEQLI